MFAIVALLVIGLWASLGYWLWLRLIGPRVQSKRSKITLTVLLTVVWFIGPVLDEIIGAREFNQLCREMPPIKFYGPVGVGPGTFFDEQGRPKWKNSDEFSAIERKDNVWWGQIFESKNEKKIIRKWPMPIWENHWVVFQKRTGKITLETFANYSKGGWVRRLIGIGDYQCPSKGPFPKDEEFITFDPKL